MRTAFNRKQFSFKDFVLHKGEYRLKIEKNTDYTRVFFDALIPYKMEIFHLCVRIIAVLCKIKRFLNIQNLRFKYVGC